MTSPEMVTALASTPAITRLDQDEGLISTPTTLHQNLSHPVQNQCFITQLSTELLLLILDFIPPESHLDFAVTCKRIANCSTSVLKRHQDAYSRYHVASDISPTTIPTLLRSIIGRADQIVAWHVRSIEIWYDRTSWRDWKTLDFDHPLHEGDTDVDAVLWKWQDDEIAGYLEDVEAQFDAMIGEGDEDIREEALEQLKDGFDGILKMLLIAHCPRLRDVKFVTQQHDKKSTLGWLKRIIQGSIAYGSYWPPGLSNIRNIAVGVESDTWMSTRNQAIMDPPNDSMLVISTLLRLLRIESVYYNDLSHRGQHDETEFDTPILLPPRSSTVKHIFLDDCGDMSYRFRSALSSAPFALESFTLRAGDSPERFEDADALVNGLADSQGHSLHTLMFYGPYTSSQIHGYRCSVYRNEELNKARNLKTVAIGMEDVELDCFYNCDGKEGEMSYDEEKKFWQRWFLESAFPRSLETLILWGKPEGSYLRKSEGHMLEWLEDALVAAIQGRLDSDDEEEEKKEDDKANDSDSDYSDWAEHAGYWNLKAVYLASLESVRSGETWSHSPPRTDKLQFQKLIGMGKQTGVDVDTVTNRTPPQHSHDFPTAPDKWDLRSGPWYARRGEISDWVFDVYQGRRVPKGCGKCGRCEDCFAEYSEELWRTLD